MISRLSSRGASIGSLVLAVSVLAGCAGIGQGSAPTASARGPGIVAEVASYRPVANQAGRLLVALFTGDNLWLSFGSVAEQFTYLGDDRATPPPGIRTDPATARFLAIPGSPEGGGSEPTLTLPADGRGVYAVESATFPKAGYWQVSVSGQLADGTTFEATAAFTVYDEPSVVTVGAPAARSDNPVLGAPGVPPAAIDSRATTDGAVPDPELHSTSIGQAIEMGHPAVVVFSTPVYCVSRFCGPVTDMIAELAGQYADRADFIHVEIYRDFQAGLVNQAALDWLKTGNEDLREPWTFLIGADGRIAGSWDTVVTRGELEPLLAALPAR